MIGLALRLTLGGGREAVARLLVMTGAVALGVGVLLTTLAGVNAVHAQNERYAWLGTGYDTATLAPGTAGSTTEAETVADVDPVWWLLRGDHVDGDLVARLDVAATGPRAPVPPGIPRLPAAGELYASPAMAERLRDLPADELSDRYPGVQVGTISDAALPSPDTLMIVIGHSVDDLSAGDHPDAALVTSISTTTPGDCSDACGPFGFDADALVLILAIVAGAVLFPVLVFVATATRLSATRREQRFAAMRLVGATPRQVAVITTVEASVAALAGVVLGLGVFGLLRPFVAEVPFTGAPFLPSDLTLSLRDVLVVLVGVPAAAAAAAALALRRVNVSPLGVSRRVTPAPPRAWRLLLLVAGLAELGWFLVVGTPETGEQQALAFLVGMTMVMAGLVLAGPWITMVVARAMASRARRPASLIASRRLADDPRSGFRAVGGLVLALFVTTAAVATITTWVDHRGTPTGDSTSAGTLAQQLSSYDADGEPRPVPTVSARTLDALRAIDGVHGAAVVRMQDADRGSRTRPRDLISCADLADVSVLGRCPAGATVAELGFWSDPDTFEEVAGTVWPASDVTEEQLAALPADTIVVDTRGSASATERARTALELDFPAARTPTTLAEDSADQLAQTTQYRRLADIVIVVSLLLAGCSLAVSVAAGLGERRRPFSLLRLSGVSLSVLRRVIVLETAAPLLAAAVLSVAAGFVAAELFVRAQLGYTLTWPGPGYWILVAVGLVASLAVIASTLPVIDRLTGPSAARND